MKNKIQRMTRGELITQITKWENLIHDSKKMRNTRRWIVGTYVVHLGLLNAELKTRKRNDTGDN
jgi:hypothetical protein